MKRKDRLSIPITINFEGKRKQFLEHLIKTNGYETMIEVGIDTGKTTFYLLEKIPNLKIIAIDTNIKKFYNRDIEEKYKERLIPIEGYSYVVADQIDNNIADIIFIDADHSYESVKQDIIKFTPKLKETGTLAGHDIDYPGVNKAVNELIENYDVGPNFVWIKRK